MSSEDFCRMDKRGVHDKSNFSRSSAVASPINSSSIGMIMVDQETELARARHHLNISADNSEDSEITEDHGL